MQMEDIVCFVSGVFCYSSCILSTHYYNTVIFLHFDPEWWDSLTITIDSSLPKLDPFFLNPQLTIVKKRLTTVRCIKAEWLWPFYSHCDASRGKQLSPCECSSLTGVIDVSIENCFHGDWYGSHDETTNDRTVPCNSQERRNRWMLQGARAIYVPGCTRFTFHAHIMLHNKYSCRIWYMYTKVAFNVSCTVSCTV